MLWEILVPVSDNQGVDFSLAHHQEFDRFVRARSDGLTLHRSAQGQWLHQGELQTERMIPVRVLCDEPSIEEIIQFTLEHYQQHAVLAYQISSLVKLRSRRD